MLLNTDSVYHISLDTTPIRCNKIDTELVPIESEELSITFCTILIKGYLEFYIIFRTLRRFEDII